jgi:hypothetical protein
MKVGDLVRFKPNSFYSASQREADVGLVIKINKPIGNSYPIVHTLWSGRTKHEVYFYYSYELEVII